MKKILVVLVAALLLSPFAAEAFDYRTWLPLLPKTLGNMSPTGDPDGMNMDMSGQKWSSVVQEYQSKDGGKAQFSVIAGQMAPQVQGFQGMAAMNMNMETGDQLIKTTTVSGKQAILVLDKQAKSGTLTIPVNQEIVVAVTLEPATSADQLTDLFKGVDISKFAK